MSTPERTVEFLETLLWHKIEEETEREKEWRSLDAKQARAHFKRADQLYRILEAIQEVKGWYAYKHGIGK